jgi:hypothetical protein
MKLIIFILSIFLLTSITFAQEINVETKGTCKEFEIAINAQLDGCWDAKIEAPAMVLHPDGWKSSFFYVNNALCAPEKETNLKIRLDTKDDIVASFKLRQNETIIERNFEIKQNCASELTDEEMLLVVATIIIVLAAGVAIYLKSKRETRRKRK